MDGSIRACAVIERGPWRDAWRRLRRNRMAVLSLTIIAMLAVASQVGPSLSPHAYDALDWSALASSPTLAGSHWLGTDHLGRDLFVRTLHGMRISLLIALFATTISVLIGVAWGATAGYVGGRVDALMMRCVDVLYSLPYIFFVIVLTVLFSRSLVLLFVAIGAVGWLTMARIVRGQALALRRREFIEAAIATGASTPRILWRHVAPNVAGPVVVYASLIVPQMILYESFLSFLGLGVQEPLASLGSLVAEGASGMESAPWMLMVPAAVLVTLLMCCNFLGDGLRDAFDPTES
ncbi:MAG TPA: ABC transporter permease subunit [Steroidobacteraceae bacterium]